MADESVLRITPIGVAPYSIRGADQTLEPIDDAGEFHRTVNGKLVNLSPSEFQKYRSTISCEDVDPPAFDGSWKGRTVVVDCIAEIGYIGTGAPDRDVVTGSERTSGGVNYYRPQITFMITGWNLTKSEYPNLTNWQMELEEV